MKNPQLPRLDNSIQDELICPGGFSGHHRVRRARRQEVSKGQNTRTSSSSRSGGGQHNARNNTTKRKTRGGGSIEIEGDGFRIKDGGNGFVRNAASNSTPISTSKPPRGRNGSRKPNRKKK